MIKGSPRKGGGGGRLQKHKDGHAKPGQKMSDPRPGTMKSYTEGARNGPGKHGVGINVGSKM